MGRHTDSFRMESKPVDEHLYTSLPFHEQDEMSRGSISDSQEHLLETQSPSRFRLRSRRRFASLPIWVNILIFGANCAILMYLYMIHDHSLLRNPADSVIEWREVSWDDSEIFLPDRSNNPDRWFKEFGHPSDEVDQAWADLIQYQNIRLDEGELREWRGQQNLVKLSDGSGYYGTLSVFHAIHCIKRTYRHINFDHYYPGATKDEKMLEGMHIQHCLNIMLQSVKCRPDLTPFPMQWYNGTRIPVGLDTGVHQCVNWDKVQDWMKGRSFEVYTPGLIVHPDLGPSYPNGRGDGLGFNLAGHDSDHHAK